jgi:hypothetical protein
MPTNNNATNRSEHLTFGSLAICGISTSCILLATGIACLIISILQIIKQTDNVDNGGNNNDVPDCGQNGKPPLLNWIFGTGISFMIITVSFYVFTSVLL